MSWQTKVLGCEREGPNESGKAAARRLKLMLPNPHSSPPSSAQRTVHQTVSRLIRGELLGPELAVARRRAGVRWTAMPEAAVHKDSDLKGGKNEVRLAEGGLMSPPACHAMQTEDFD